MFDANTGNVTATVAAPHDGVIQSLLPHPFGFLTTGNDGNVVVYTADGTIIQVRSHVYFFFFFMLLFVVVALYDGVIQPF
jgi:hypothetical protein